MEPDRNKKGKRKMENYKYTAQDIAGGLAFVIVVAVATALYLAVTPNQMSAECERAAEIR